jgi:hypothetical protein
MAAFGSSGSIIYPPLSPIRTRKNLRTGAISGLARQRFDPPPPAGRAPTARHVAHGGAIASVATLLRHPSG